MLNFHIIKVTLKNGESRYRTILTKSGKGIKTKTFRRKQDARTWGTRAVVEHQEYEAKGIRPCTIPFDRLADEYMSWWSGKDHDRARLVKWWVGQFGKTLLPDITPDEIRAKLKPKRSQAGATYNRYLAGRLILNHGLCHPAARRRYRNRAIHRRKPLQESPLAIPE